MPIRIDDFTDVPEGEKPREAAWLASDDWELPSQLEVLKEWIEEAGADLPPGDYVVDIGFAPREDAAGGGGVLTPEAMKIMVEKGMTLFLSEYPPLVEDSSSQE